MKHTYKDTLHACYLGYITQAIVNNLAPLLFIIFREHFHISFEMIGRLILINFGTQIIADIVTIKFVHKIGYRKATILAHGFCVVGLVSLGLLPQIFATPYFGLVIAVIIYAIGGGIIEVLISPIVESLPGEEKDSAMSLLHSFYCWGQVGVVLLTTIFIKIFGEDIWFILPVLWSLIPMYNLFKFIKVPLMPIIPEKEATPLKELLTSRFFLIALVLMMCAGASELTMSQWSSLFAEKGLGVSKLMGDLLGPCLFAIFMGTGRTLYGIWGYKVRLKKILLISGVLCIACYLVTVFSPNPIISLLGCAVCGLSVSLMWPGTFSLTVGKYPRGGTIMFGLLAIFGDLGAAIGPWFAGGVSDWVQKSSRIIDFGTKNNFNIEQLGLKIGLLTALIFPLALLIGILSLKRVTSTITSTAT